jgi:hypothetical protein
MPVAFTFCGITTGKDKNPSSISIDGFQLPRSSAKQESHQTWSEHLDKKVKDLLLYNSIHKCHESSIEWIEMQQSASTAILLTSVAYGLLPAVCSRRT